MPLLEELDGIGAVREIIKFDPKAKILIISAMTNQALGLEAVCAGAKDFINKPFKPAQVIKAVEKITRQATDNKP